MGAELAVQLRVGDGVLFEGPLGAGKTTFIRGMLEGLGFHDAVRSPTFNLIQTFPTDPPVMHADLYRLQSADGIGLEDYLETHLCLIEWPDRAGSLIEASGCYQVTIDFVPEGRRIEVQPPSK